MAAALDVEPAEVVFTSGGTEADALGVLGAARAARGRHIVVSALEHPAVMRCAEALAGDGYDAGRRRPGRERRRQRGGRRGGRASRYRRRGGDAGEQRARHPSARRRHRAPAGVGGDRKRPGRPHLHVDAVQAFGLSRLRPRALGADSVALSAHKLHGPRGAGALWLRPGARLAPLWVGGGQERGLRGGSENLPALVGFGVAAASRARPCKTAQRTGSRPSAITSSRRR